VGSPNRYCKISATCVKHLDMTKSEFNLQPVLRGNRVTLRPLVENDFDAMYAIGGDPLVWEQHPHSDRWQRSEFEKFFAGAIESKGAFAIIENASGKLIGSSRFHEYDASERSVSIDYTFYGREFWGGKFNPEAKKLMLEHAFQFVDRVHFHVGECNVRSQKAMGNVGARHVRTIPPELPIDAGKNVFVYEITRESYVVGPLVQKSF
jgi:N-acetyltransferase